MPVIGLLFCSLMFQGVRTSAQEVALVLSGGGARGLAHLGVIKALEENNIPVSYITGTSMGAIIGGLYACGYTPDEIEKFALSPQLEKWASGKAGQEAMFYFNAHGPDASWIKLRFEFDEITNRLESRLPTNLLSPNLMDYAMMELFSAASAAAGYDFDSLFIPFRCVAADIDSNKTIVFGKGQLGHAIRASMTYPFYFKPIELDGRLLFDGGLYDNFPVNVALTEFNPDFVIGSKTTWNFPAPSEEDIITQIQNMVTRETSFNIPDEIGIVIEPDLPPVNVIDFSHNRELIDSGYVAAMRMMPQILEKVRNHVSTYELNEKRQAFNMKKPPAIVDSIKVIGLNRMQTRYVERLFKTRPSSFTFKSIRRNYFRLLSDSKIRYVFPSLVQYPGRPFYELDLKITKAEHFSIDFGGNISSGAASTGFAGVQYNLLARIGLMVLANGYFGRFYSAANAEIRVDIPGRLPVFIKADMTYNHMDYFKNSTYFFEDKDPSFLISNESHANLESGIPITDNGVFSLNAAVGFTKDNYYQTNQFSRTDTSDITYFDFYTPGVKIEFNTLNYKQFPSKGYKFLCGFRYINGQERTIPGSTSADVEDDTVQFHDWLQLKLLYNKYFYINKWISIGLYSEILLSSQELFSNYTATILRTPAFEPVPEMKTLFLPKYRSAYYVGVGIQPVVTLYKNLDARLEGFLLQPFQKIQQNENKDAIVINEPGNMAFVLSGSLVYQVRRIPISLSFNYYSQGADRFSVLFNIGFIIFNKSALE